MCENPLLCAPSGFPRNCVTHSVLRISRWQTIDPQPQSSLGTSRRRMAIAPNDPRHRDLTASDVLSPLTWPRRGARPAVGLDVICTKIAVDFQGMTEATAADCILAESRIAARGHPAPTRRFTSYSDADLDDLRRSAGGSRHAGHRQPGAAARAEPETSCPGCARAWRRCACRNFAIPPIRGTIRAPMPAAGANSASARC